MLKRHIESDIQKNCVKWFRLQYPKLATLLFAVPNGGARNKTEAGIMKGEGVTAGVSDLIFLFPNSKYHALCIEMKTPKGTQQDSQKQWQQKVEAAGYKYIICRSFEEFQSSIWSYLSQI
ncbi:MAG: VRR-NUC domain-containing protein [Prevotella sp.]|nr:VRR-NUC domain-containing protein [Bacteroides sp.]MCM1445852.1 VRR-NUC domain-containing protein [Prevotella sp.]